MSRRDAFDVKSTVFLKYLYSVQSLTLVSGFYYSITVAHMRTGISSWYTGRTWLDIEEIYRIQYEAV
jgi:hypothetical protein